MELRISRQLSFCLEWTIAITIANELEQLKNASFCMKLVGFCVRNWDIYHSLCPIPVFLESIPFHHIQP